MPTAATIDVSAALAAAKLKYKSTDVDRPVPYGVDLGHLLVTDPNVLDIKYDRIANDPSWNRSADDLETFLRDNTRDGVQTLINAIWEMPTEPSPDQTTILAQLPAPTTTVPREKPIPKQKDLTRWERFAKEKGIQNRKKTRMAWDEETKSWRPRWGYQAANNDEPWVVEVPENADPMQDQFEKLREAKKDRVAKNKKNQERNQQNNSSIKDVRKRELERGLAVSKVSTASLGRFDRELKGDKTKSLKRGNVMPIVGSSEEKDMTQRVIKKVVRDSDSNVLNERKVVAIGMQEEQKKRRAQKSTGKGAPNKKQRK